MQAAAELLKKIKAGCLQDGFTARQVRRKGWHLLKGDAANDACAELVDANILKEIITKPEFGKPGFSGQGKTEYLINPKVIEHG